MSEVKTGQIYRHFKGNLYQIVAVARHSETNEEYVVYQALYGDMKVWVRPYSMFVSEVDHDKYPDVAQRYRFELLNTIAGSGAQQTASDKQAPREQTVREQVEAALFQKQDITVQKCEKEKEGENSAQSVQIPQEEEQERADERLLAFLDAETCQDKINYLTLIRNNIDDRLINDIAAAMDITVDEGPIDARYYSLKSCLMTKAKYECGRR